MYTGNYQPPSFGANYNQGFNAPMGTQPAGAYGAGSQNDDRYGGKAAKDPLLLITRYSHLIDLSRKRSFILSF